MATYVMCVRNGGYWLVGPFDKPPVGGPDRFNDFIDHGPANPKDDPRWQTVDLNNPTTAPRVFTLAEHVEFVRRDRSPEMPEEPSRLNAGYSGVELDVIARFINELDIPNPDPDTDAVPPGLSVVAEWMRQVIKVYRDG